MVVDDRVLSESNLVCKFRYCDGNAKTQIRIYMRIRHFWFVNKLPIKFALQSLLRLRVVKTTATTVILRQMKVAGALPINI